LIPGSPAALSMPSYIALGGWTILGLIFFIVRYPKLKRMNNDYLSQMILNRTDAEVEDILHEEEKNN
jgi:hypothetical protein